MGCKKLQLNDYFRFVGNELDIQYSESQYRKDRPTGFSTYNANDQLTLEYSTAKGDTIYSYDANGSQIGKVNTTANEFYLYTYNLQNRLQTATITRTETDPMGGLSKLVDITSAYVYNQSGIRVGANTSTKVDGGTPEVKNTVYLTDPANFTGYAQVLEQFDDGTLTKSYTLGDDVLSQTSFQNSSTPEIKNFLYDGHGSTRLLTSATSAIAGRFDYDAYGKSVGFVSNVTSPASTDMLYSGEQFDPNLQMQYLRAGYYDQNAGVFNRLDDYMGDNYDPQSLHKYAYCHGNPVMGIDPTGHFSLIEMTVTNSIMTILTSMFTEVASPILKKFGGLLIPQGLKAALMGAFHPSALDIGASATGVKNGVGIVGGLELLFSPKTDWLTAIGSPKDNWDFALFGNLGGTLSSSGGTGSSAAISIGAVYNCPTSRDFRGPFWSITMPFKMLPNELRQWAKHQLKRYLFRKVPYSKMLEKTNAFNRAQSTLIDNAFNFIEARLDTLSISLFSGLGYSATQSAGFAIAYSTDPDDAISVSLTGYWQAFPKNDKTVQFHH